jgi:uncharacterized protein (DUF1778 family)
MRREKTVPESVTATAVLRRREKIVLPQADWDLFLRAVVNPPPPNRILKTAAKRFRDRRGD